MRAADKQIASGESITPHLQTCAQTLARQGIHKHLQIGAE
jgi:hypothetical protein